MPRELTQNRIQKIWIPSKDDKPAVPRRLHYIGMENTFVENNSVTYERINTVYMKG